MNQGIWTGRIGDLINGLTIITYIQSQITHSKGQIKIEADTSLVLFDCQI